MIGTRVRSRRQQLGGLAHLLGFKTAYIARIESRGTTLPNLIRLCRALETTPNYLLGFARRP